ncbi:hypothetical protein JTE90_010192 [Oedothorax gibbosus]|uniref:ZP domain-containing protein n=1 Tax=Oedothorax gibbosus TaxID=931172 RepID=A0AAV6UJ37_9ARAC|nr:hypothetical protein JTE90_010192 [Oedothorax gibbosus]
MHVILFPCLSSVIGPICPVDLTVSDKVYVDDQSRTTGDYYLYIPFRMFRFLDGSKVRFSCNVIVCQHDCPWADCGDYMGMSYGRRKRSAPKEFDPAHTLTVTNEVTVMDEDHRTPRSKGTGIVEEEILLPKLPPANPKGATPTSSSPLPAPLEYLVGGAALAVSLMVSVCVNVYLIVFLRRRIRKNCDVESTGAPSVILDSSLYMGGGGSSLYRSNLYDRYSPRTEWKFESREILYPPMPIRHARTNRRSHSFRY